MVDLYFKSMKIIYIASSKLPSREANSIHVMKMCRAFASNGFSTSLVAPKYAALRSIHDADIFRFYGVDRIFRLIRLRRYTMPGAGIVFGLMAAITAKNRKPDTVYARSLVGAFFSALLGLSVVFETHTPLSRYSLHERMMFSVITSTNRLRRIVVISEYLKKAYLSLPSVSNNNIEVIVASDAADRLVTSDCNGMPTFQNDRFRIGYIGHLYPGRGIELIEELASMNNWADFHIVGGTDKDIEYWCQRLKGQENVFLHGFVSPAMVECYRRQFDILIAPYQSVVSIAGKGDTAKWMSPLKIFEYMSAEKPIICSDVPVIREVLEHNRNAILCDPGSPACWSEQLLNILNDEELRKTLARNAREDFLKYYSWEARAANVLKGL